MILQEARPLRITRSCSLLILEDRLVRGYLLKHGLMSEIRT